MSLKFEHSKIDKNNNDKEQKSIEFGGVGEDGGDIFRVEKAALDKDGAVEIVKKYVGKMSYRCVPAPDTQSSVTDVYQPLIHMAQLRI